MELDLISEEATLLPRRDTLATLNLPINLSLPINVGVATPVALAISINAGSIGTSAAAIALNGIHLFG